MEIPCEVPEGSGAETVLRFRCRYSYLVRLQKVQVQVPGEVPEGFGANTF